MKKNILNIVFPLVLILGFFIVPAGFSKATVCYEAANFGTSAVNGTYTDINTPSNSKPQYTNGTYYLFNTTAYGSGDYVIEDHSAPVSGNVFYYFDPSPNVPTSTGWTAQDGSSPGGTLSLTTCPGGGGESTSTPTSTLDYINTNGNIAYVVTIFFSIIVFLISVWIGAKL